MSRPMPSITGDRAQRAEDAADAERVADRLAQAVAGRDLEVAQGRGVPADLDRVDDVVGAVQRGAAVERAPSMRRPRAERASASSARQRLGGREPLGVDVVQGDLDVVQSGR